MKLLYAEDEKDLRRSLSRMLRKHGYETDDVPNGKIAAQMGLANDYDLMIFDILMEEMSGIEALKILRENGIKTPVLLLTAKDSILDKIEGLDAGANDYITKPFSIGELLARIRVLTRERAAEKGRFVCGNLVLVMETSELSVGSTSFKLSNKEIEVMKLLLGQKDQMVTTLKLKQKVWNVETDEKIIPLYLSFLNKKLTLAGADLKIAEKSGMIYLKQVSD